MTGDVGLGRRVSGSLARLTRRQTVLGRAGGVTAAQRYADQTRSAIGIGRAGALITAIVLCADRRSIDPLVTAAGTELAETSDGAAAAAGLAGVAGTRGGTNAAETARPTGHARWADATNALTRTGLVQELTRRTTRGGDAGTIAARTIAAGTIAECLSRRTATGAVRGVQSLSAGARISAHALAKAVGCPTGRADHTAPVLSRPRIGTADLAGGTRYCPRADTGCCLRFGTRELAQPERASNCRNHSSFERGAARHRRGKPFG